MRVQFSQRKRQRVVDGKWLGFPPPASITSTRVQSTVQCKWTAVQLFFPIALISTWTAFHPCIALAHNVNRSETIVFLCNTAISYRVPHCMSLHWKVLDCIWLQGVALSWHLAHWTWFLVLTNISFFVWQTCISLVYISPESIDQHSRQFRKINRFCSESVPCQGSALKLKLFSD